MIAAATTTTTLLLSSHYSSISSSYKYALASPSTHFLSTRPLLGPSPRTAITTTISSSSSSSSSSRFSTSLLKTTDPNLQQAAPCVGEKRLFSSLRNSLAAIVIAVALNFSPVVVLPTLLLGGAEPAAVASEFDVLRDGPPPSDSYVVDDANVLSRLTKSDLKNLLSDLEYRKNLRINFVTVRKLTSKADAFEFADQVLEKWYPSIEEGNDKGVVVLVTTQKEGAITGGPKFIQAVGDNILDATVSENLPVLATDERYNEAVLSSAKRLVAAIDGLPDPGGPKFKDNKRESNYKTREETEEKRGQFTLVVGGLLVIAFVVPMAQYYAYVSRK